MKARSCVNTVCHWSTSAACCFCKCDAYCYCVLMHDAPAFATCAFVHLHIFKFCRKHTSRTWNLCSVESLRKCTLICIDLDQSSCVGSPINYNMSHLETFRQSSHRATLQGLHHVSQEAVRIILMFNFTCLISCDIPNLVLEEENGMRKYCTANILWSSL